MTHTPVLNALLEGEEWEEAWFIMGTPFGKEEACTPDSEGSFPLHHAVDEEAPPRLLLAILLACPEAARHPNTRGVLPLNRYIVTRRANLHVVDALIRAYPPAVQSRSPCGRFALHFVTCRQGGMHSAALMRQLLRAYPKAAAMPNCDGELPLHLAVRCFKKGDTDGSVVDKVSTLLKVYPLAARAVNMRGRLPLHELGYLLQSLTVQVNMLKVPQLAKVSQLLLSVYPEAAIIPNEQGVSWNQHLSRVQQPRRTRRRNSPPDTVQNDSRRRRRL